MRHQDIFLIVVLINPLKSTLGLCSLIQGKSHCGTEYSDAPLPMVHASLLQERIGLIAEFVCHGLFPECAGI